MADRRDPVAGAARVIAGIESTGLDLSAESNHTVMTVGRINIEREGDQPPASLDADIVRRLAEAAESLGVRLPTVPSGALHDAAVIAPYPPAAMLFIPSRDGISHHPDEFSRIENIATAARITAAMIS